MRARDHQHIAANRADAGDDPVGADAYLLGRFAARSAVAKQLPVRALAQDVGGAPALIVAVIPFGEVGIDFGERAPKPASAQAALRAARGW